LQSFSSTVPSALPSHKPAARWGRFRRVTAQVARRRLTDICVHKGKFDTENCPL